MTAQIEVRRATLDDWPMIGQFIADCYGAAAPFKDHRRWRWQFLDTPYSPATPQPPVWIAVDQGRVAGQLAVQPGCMILEGRPYPAGWIVDVMIRPEYRGLGLGHRIHDAILASGATVVTLTMALATRRIAERAGCITLGPVQQLVRPGRLSGRTLSVVLERIIENRSGLPATAARLFVDSGVGPAALAGFANLAGLWRRNRGDVHGLDVRDTEAPSLAEAAALMDGEAAGYPARYDRSESFLEWRLRQAPALVYRWIEARREGALAGLATWRLPDPIELPVGTLTDILAPADDVGAIEALTDAAVGRMAGQVEAIIAGASHPAHLRALRRQGFIRVKTHRPTVVTRNAALRADLERLKDAWHFTKLDHDWDQIHPAHD